MDHLVPAGLPAAGVHSPSVLSNLIRHPWHLLALLCLMQILCWTVAPALINVSPPNDVVEGFMWGREWVLLTYKHPQLPAWLLETSHLLTGSFRWPQYLVAQLTISATFVLVYLLARDMLGQRRALAAVLLMPSLYFFGWPTPQFNHDYAQMPFWAAICWLLWRAGRGGGPVWWLALGLVSGVGLYAKFSTGLLLLFGAIWLLSDARARSRLATPWPWLGLAVCVAVAAPLAIELYRVDFLPLTYAAWRDQWVMAHRSRFYYIGVQAAGLCGFFLVLAISGLLRRSPPPQEPVGRSTLVYLLWMGLGPAILIMVASLFTGTGEAWGAPMYNLAGVVALAFLGHRLGAVEMRKLVICALICIIAISGAYAGIRWTKCNLRGRMDAVCWPAQKISDEAEAVWHAATPGRLDIVGGHPIFAPLAGLNAYDKPSIFTELNMQYAPWITKERLREHGILLVWPGRDVPSYLQAWVGDIPVKTVLFDWSLKAPPVAISFAAIPPGARQLPGAIDSLAQTSN